MDEIDPIDELHEIRRRLIEKAGGTVEAYIRQVMEYERRHPEGLVDLSQPKAVPAKPRRHSASAKPKAKATAARGKPASRKPAQRRKAVAAQ